MLNLNGSIVYFIPRHFIIMESARALHYVTGKDPDDRATE